RVFSRDWSSDVCSPDLPGHTHVSDLSPIGLLRQSLLSTDTTMTSRIPIAGRDDDPLAAATRRHHFTENGADGRRITDIGDSPGKIGRASGRGSGQETRL